MVDLKLFENILDNDCGYIEEGDTLTEEFFERMSKYPPSRVEKLFKKMKPTSTKFALKLKYECERCGNMVEKVISKTKTIELLKSKESFKCSVCLQREKEEEDRRLKIEREEQRKNNVEIIKKNTDGYIESYLSPDNIWNDGMKNNKKIFNLKNDIYCDRERIKNYIKDMRYYDFLKTPYWKAIAERVKIKADFRCSLCNSNKNLSVHHRTYSIHGDELYNMNELVCICQECHEKHHDIY